MKAVKELSEEAIDDMSDEDVKAALQELESQVNEEPTADQLTDPADQVSDTDQKADPEDLAAGEDPEAQSGEAADDTDDASNPEMVPHRKFHRERERVKDLEAQLAQRDKRLDEIVSAMNKQTPATEPEKTKEPTFEEQIAAAQADNDFLKVQELQTAQIKQLQERNQNREQAEESRGQLAQLETRVEAAATEQYQAAVAERPEIAGAYTHLFAAKVQEHMLNGKPQQIAAQHARVDALNLYYNTLKSGGSVPQVVEQYARIYGWTPEMYQNSEDPGQGGETQQVSEEAAGQVADLQAKADAQDAATSLGKSGSPVISGLPSIEEYVNMSDADIEALKQKHGDYLLAKISAQ